MSTLLKFRAIILVTIGVFTAALLCFTAQLTYDYDIEQLFPIADPELQFHQEVDSIFAFHQDYLILGIENENGIFNTSFLPKLDSLANQLQQHELVREVNTVTNLRYAFKTPFGVKNLPFLHPHNAERYCQDSVFLHAYTDVAPKFISNKNTAVCCYIFLEKPLKEDNKEAMRTFINEAITNLGFERHHLYGDVFAQGSYIKELEAEMYWLTGLSMLLIVVVLFLNFGSFSGIFLPVLIVAITIIWTMGTIAIFGRSINMLTVLIPTIVSIIALSDVIHIFNHFQHQETDDKETAIAHTLKEMRIAILLTSFTTGLGFITLAYSNISPIIEFGIFTAIGVVYAYLLAIVLLPILLFYFPVKSKTKNIKGHLIEKMYKLVDERPGIILVATMGVLLISIAGMTKLSVNSYLYEELSSKDDFSETLHFFEEHFSGIRTFDLFVEAVDSNKTMLSQDVLVQLDKLEYYLLNEYGLNEVYSIATDVKRANRVVKDGDPDAFVLPQEVEFVKYLSSQILENREQNGLQSILSNNNKKSRIRGKINDVGSAVIKEKNENLHQFIQQKIDSSLIKTKLTGSTLLLDKSNEMVSHKILGGLLFAAMIVSLLMGLLYKSIKIMFIAIVPNLLPLIMILGIIGWAGLGLKISTVIIFTIAFGIAVDDTIHFMNKLKNEIRKGLAIHEAVKNTYLTTGRAILTTSIILILGFGVLLLSAFQTTFMTGLLVSLALLFALFADLLLLPVLLLSERKKIR